MSVGGPRSDEGVPRSIATPASMGVTDRQVPESGTHCANTPALVCTPTQRRSAAQAFPAPQGTPQSISPAGLRTQSPPVAHWSLVAHGAQNPPPAAGTSIATTTSPASLGGVIPLSSVVILPASTAGTSTAGIAGPRSAGGSAPASVPSHSTSSTFRAPASSSSRGRFSPPAAQPRSNARSPSARGEVLIRGQRYHRRGGPIAPWPPGSGAPRSVAAPAAGGAQDIA